MPQAKHLFGPNPPPPCFPLNSCFLTFTRGQTITCLFLGPTTWFFFIRLQSLCSWSSLTWIAANAFTWWFCLHSLERMLIWLPLEKLAPSWCCNLLTLSPTSPSLDVPKSPFNPYNHYRHSSLLTPLRFPSLITHKKEKKVNKFSSQFHGDPMTLIAKSFWEAYPPFPYSLWSSQLRTRTI